MLFAYTAVNVGRGEAMRAIITIMLLMILVCPHAVFAQAQPMYDPTYSGPVNIYGQPAYGVPMNNPPGYVQQTQPFPGLVPLGISQAQSAASYLWSYMPAPWRGGPSPYAVPPGSATVNFVPGTP